LQYKIIKIKMSNKESQEIKPTQEELMAIEVQRQDVEKLNVFRTEYKMLVEKTGFAWVVDANSQLNNIQLGIAKIQQ